MVLGVANGRNRKVQLLKCGNQEIYRTNHHSPGAKSALPPQGTKRRSARVGAAGRPS